ncbi:MAG: AAA family ATPase [Anaerolineales bacterium]|nr:AAA family ATPase [Anaerolineales bacterium]
MQRRITDDLEALLRVIPTHICDKLRAINRPDELLEVILDLGRVPTARFTDGEVVLAEAEITREELDYVITRIGAFDADNRAGMERTLHRISGIRNRRGQVVGLTCRVGRAVYGTIDIIQDIIESGKSVLLLGAPGVGKTTMLREAARILADNKRVVIVDTSNEIGGDGDVPHPAVGRARRMQVSQPSLQHEVMIEAVENHNPQVIVIDEIGRQLEAEAARTIAERGVQLIGTAHGNSLENILLNPTLADLVGGIESVTLSDEEARRRGTQKTVLERRAPPTFDVLIEILQRENLNVHPDVGAAVDSFLRGRPIPPEKRFRDEAGQLRIEQPAPEPQRRGYGANGGQSGNGRGLGRTEGGNLAGGPVWESRHRALPAGPPAATPGAYESEPGRAVTAAAPVGLAPVRIYAYGIARNRLEQAAKRLRLPAAVTEDLADAQALVTLKTYYRRHQSIVSEAEERGLPIYVLRSNTVGQMENFLSDLFNLSTPAADEEDANDALAETQQAITAVLNGTASVDLPPASAYVRRLQHELARKANLISHSYGKEPRRRVRIFRD